jgi:hypothetical protein
VVQTHELASKSGLPMLFPDQECQALDGKKLSECRAIVRQGVGLIDRWSLKPFDLAAIDRRRAVVQQLFSAALCCAGHLGAGWGGGIESGLPPLMRRL